MMVPKMNGTSSTSKGHSFITEAGTLAKTSNNIHTPTSKLAQNSVGINLDTSYNALLNTSKLSSSNSPSTNGTNTTGMDSSRDNPNADFELSTRISPPTPNISTSHHQQNPMNLTSYQHQNSTQKPFQ